MSERLVYVDGEYFPKSEAKISVFDHGYLYGDGVFEGIRAYSGRIFRLEQHIERLYDSARALALEPPVSPDELMRLTAETVRVNELTDAYIRLVVSRGKGDLGLDPRKCPVPTIVIIADSIQLYPEHYYAQGLEVITVATRRNHTTALSPKVKSLNYLNNIMAKIELNRAGMPEGLMLNAEGYVAEATGDNVFLVKRGKLYTPPEYAGLLVGITREAVMELAAQRGYEVQERLFTLYDVYCAEEAFLTGTAAEVIPVVKIDGRPIGEGQVGSITKELIQAFRQLVVSEGYPVYD
jgi:branched-chain amino acid aminotransferase